MFEVQSGGIVFLVGAGPGDPSLITVGGKALLESADVVLTDHLASEKLLRYCPQAEITSVGKRAGESGISQDEINELMIRHARSGKRVVRLKGGDPFLFGRGGEECEALRAANVAFEVVPGITSALGAAACAGIPLTHRDLNTSVTFITAHTKDDSPIDFTTLAKLPCVLFYMGVKAIDSICEGLTNAGANEQTPAAIVQDATLPTQRVIVGTLKTLPRLAREQEVRSPSLVIVGQNVNLHATLNWQRDRPLLAQRIVVTRMSTHANDLTDQLEALGADVLASPTIATFSADDQNALDHVLRRASDFDWIVFLSGVAVNEVAKVFEAKKFDARTFGDSRIVAVGRATAALLESMLHVYPDFQPTQIGSDALVEELTARDEIVGRSFLLLRTDVADSKLSESLIDAGAARVETAIAYMTRLVKDPHPQLVERLHQRGVDWITFTSASTVDGLVQQLNGGHVALLRHVKLASIGPTTSAALVKHGFHPTVEAKGATFEMLVKAITESARAAVPDA